MSFSIALEQEEQEAAEKAAAQEAAIETFFEENSDEIKDQQGERQLRVSLKKLHTDFTQLGNENSDINTVDYNISYDTFCNKRPKHIAKVSAKGVGRSGILWTQAATSSVAIKATDYINAHHVRLGSVFMNQTEMQAHALIEFKKSGVDPLSVARLVISGRCMGLRQQTSEASREVARDGAIRAGRSGDKIYVYEDCRILTHGQDHIMNRVEQGADMNTDLSVNHHFVYMLR